MNLGSLDSFTILKGGTFDKRKMKVQKVTNSES